MKCVVYDHLLWGRNKTYGINITWQTTMVWSKTDSLTTVSYKRYFYLQICEQMGLQQLIVTVFNLQSIWRKHFVTKNIKIIIKIIWPPRVLSASCCWGCSCIPDWNMNVDSVTLRLTVAVKETWWVDEESRVLKG